VSPLLLREGHRDEVRLAVGDMGLVTSVDGVAIGEIGGIGGKLELLSIDTLLK
jgi:hypothetical protein